MEELDDTRFIMTVKVEVERFYNIAYRLRIYLEKEFLNNMNLPNAL
jgi:hypothetical protein